MSQAKFEFFVEDIKYQWDSQYITGAEIRALAHLEGPEELFLSVVEPWDDKPIAADEKVDLGRGTQRLYLKKKLTITINKVSFEWGQEYITLEQIRELGKIAQDHEIFLEIARPGEDELVTAGKPINVALRGTEHFHDRPREIIIIVNGTPKKWDKDKITFREVIILAFDIYIDRPTMVYTVAYEDGPHQNPEGSMVRDSVVFVKNKMIFHATATDKS
ncbi:MAG: multiubiquitin domain-containing protein [Chitinophagaceae bacterium]|nr:multiubiquitin domain-containing protein [Chitinophagaceae bacterium]